MTTAAGIRLAAPSVPSLHSRCRTSLGTPSTISPSGPTTSESASRWSQRPAACSTTWLEGVALSVGTGAPVARPMLNVKVPSIGWPSAEIARQRTVYVPTALAATGVVISVGSSRSTVACVASGLPSGSRTRIALDDGASTASLNQMWISRGSDSMTAPAAGWERRSSACGHASRGTRMRIARARATGPALARTLEVTAAYPRLRADTARATRATSSEDPPSHSGIRDGGSGAPAPA